MTKTRSLPDKVSARFLRESKTIGEPKTLLAQFELEVKKNTIDPNEQDVAQKTLLLFLLSKQKDPSLSERGFPGLPKAVDLAYSAYFKVTGRAMDKIVELGRSLFLSLLQEYTLPGPLRKKVEIASRFYVKAPKPRLKELGVARHLEHFMTYDKYRVILEDHLDLAKKAVASGKSHVEGETKVKVGSFTLINTGGFDEKVMSSVADIVQKAQALTKSCGLGEVCYGDIQITNTLNKGTTLAFYEVSSDELFIRANHKSNDLLQTLLHELGHRFDVKFLKGRDMDITHLHYVLSGQESSRRFDPTTPKPKIGDTITSKGKTYRVTEVRFQRSGYQVLLEDVKDPKRTSHISLEGWNALLKGGEVRNTTDPSFKGYVSAYAKSGGPRENFAEMFAYYCLGKMNSEHNKLFEEVAFRGSRTASDHTVLRVAACWILEG